MTRNPSAEAAGRPTPLPRSPRRIRLGVLGALVTLVTATQLVGGLSATPSAALAWPGDPGARGDAQPDGSPGREPRPREAVAHAAHSRSVDLAPATGATWPLAPEPDLVRGFEPPAARWHAGHRGVDLVGRPGQPVLAALAGEVSFAGRIAGRGVVVVSHGTTRTTYEPVAASVAAGDRVSTGDPIGTLELLGSHCLPRACLHWGLRESDTYLDPLRLLGLGPVRLLPWDGVLP